MDNTHEFVEKIHQNQDKQKKNQQHQGKGTPSERLANKQHSTKK